MASLLKNPGPGLRGTSREDLDQQRLEYNNSQGSTGSRLGDLGGQVIGEWLVGCLVGGSDIPEYLSHVCDWLIAHVYPLVTCKPLNHLEPVLQTQLFTIWVCLIIKMLQVEPEAEDSCLIFEGVVKQKLGVCLCMYIYIM